MSCFSIFLRTEQPWFGTISEGIVAVDLPSPLRDICQVQADAWTCERKQIDIGLGPSDVCTANNIFVYQNLDWKVGSARWTRTSPTGDSVVFDAKLSGPGYRIYFRAVDPTSQQFHFEIPGEQASWSPDGEKLVYRSGRNNQAGLWISNRDDSNPIRLTDNGTDSFPAWSPDGQTIVFSREVQGDVELGAINVDGSNLRWLTNARGPDTLPVFTPSGGIIFRSGRTGSWSIWQMNGDGSGKWKSSPMPRSAILIGLSIG
jgi:Tol biopolymer transport system component